MDSIYDLIANHTALLIPVLTFVADMGGVYGGKKVLDRWIQARLNNLEAGALSYIEQCKKNQASCQSALLKEVTELRRVIEVQSTIHQVNLLSFTKLTVLVESLEKRLDEAIRRGRISYSPDYKNGEGI